MKSKTFPWTLHAMLELAEKENFDGVVSWLPDGKSFKVYDPSAFVKDIMPNFFQQSKYKSFQRQCKYCLCFRRNTSQVLSNRFATSHTIFRSHSIYSESLGFRTHYERYWQRRIQSRRILLS